MRLSPAPVNADDLSTAWLETCRAVSGSTDQRVFHQVTRIARPTVEVPDLRDAVDDILAAAELDPVDTVANTIFPAAMARNCATSDALGERYRRAYPRIKKFPGNEKGTYFGRLVAYPYSQDQHCDQLAQLLEKFRTERRTPGPMSARYEVSIESAEQDLPEGGPGDQEPGSAPCVAAHSASIVVPAKNTARMGFPCMSLCSFQLDGSYLHMVAHYRSQYMIQRAYGNYVGLGHLLAYVAENVGLMAGELMVVAGYAQIDSNGRRQLSRLLRSTS